MKSSRVLKGLACAMLVMSLMVQTATALTTSYHVVVARAAVAYGQSSEPSGVLWAGSSGYDGANGLNGKPVWFYYRRLGSSTWTKFTTTQTEGFSFAGITINGIFGLTHRPTRNIQYQTRFLGDGTYSASTSNTWTTYVRPKVWLSRRVIKSKRIIRLRARVKPRNRGKIVVFKVRKKGEKRWRRLGKARLNSKGYALLIKKYGSKTKGLRYIKAVIGKSSAYAAARSKTVGVRL